MRITIQNLHGLDQNTLFFTTTTTSSVFQNLDLVILDNSVRESTVGQLKGHTAEDKFKIYEEARKCGFKVSLWFQTKIIVK